MRRRDVVLGAVSLIASRDAALAWTIGEDKIGYLHLSAMSYNNQTRFEREAYEYIVGKDAMIIDERWNGKDSFVCAEENRS